MDHRLGSLLVFARLHSRYRACTNCNRHHRSNPCCNLASRSSPVDRRQRATQRLGDSIFDWRPSCRDRKRRENFVFVWCAVIGLDSRIFDRNYSVFHRDGGGARWTRDRSCRVDLDPRNRASGANSAGSRRTAFHRRHGVSCRRSGENQALDQNRLGGSGSSLDRQSRDPAYAVSFRRLVSDQPCKPSCRADVVVGSRRLVARFREPKPLV